MARRQASRAEPAGSLLGQSESRFVSRLASRRPTTRLSGPDKRREPRQTINEAEDLRTPKPAACSGPLEPLVGRFLSCL